MSDQIERIKNKRKKTQISGLLSFWERDVFALGGKEMNTSDSLNYFLNSGNHQNSSEYTICETPNPSVMYLTNFLRKNDAICDFVNSFRHEKAKLDKLLACDPLVVAITTTFVLNWETLLEITKYIRQRQPSTRIVIGGPYIWTICHFEKNQCQHLMKTIGADMYVFEGQGESALAEIIYNLKRNKDVSDVYNLFFRYPVTNSFIYTGKKAEHTDIDRYAINWSEFDENDIGETVTIRTSRGCPFKCSFCDYHVRNSGLDLVSLETIEMELTQLRQSGVKYISFIDDTFNLSEKRLRAICRMMIDHKFGFEWNSFFRCSSMYKAEVYDLMQESGCKAIFIGVESTDPNVLKNMNKISTWNYVEDAVAQFNKRNIITTAHLIFGFPGETEESALNTINTICNSGFHLARAQLFLLLNGAPIVQDAGKFRLQGDIFDWNHATMDYSTANEWCNQFVIDSAGTGPIWSTNDMTSFDMGYFRAMGMSYDQISEYARLTHRIIKAKLLSSASDYTTSPEYQVAVIELEQFANTLSLRPSKFKHNL
jgi:p-methyltransferase